MNTVTCWVRDDNERVCLQRDRPGRRPPSETPHLYTARLMEQIASGQVLQQAYRWLCRRRQDYPPDDDELRLKKHRHKTFFGRVRQGFDFLGYRFSAVGLSLAAKTKQRFVDRAARLQEQGAAASRIGQYVRHWLTWCRSGGLEHLWDAFVETIARALTVRRAAVSKTSLKES